MVQFCQVDVLQRPLSHLHVFAELKVRLVFACECFSKTLPRDNKSIQKWQKATSLLTFLTLANEM